jgi:hypothetical protein
LEREIKSQNERESKEAKKQAVRRQYLRSLRQRSNESSVEKVKQKHSDIEFQQNMQKKQHLDTMKFYGNQTGHHKQETGEERALLQGEIQAEKDKGSLSRNRKKYVA